MTSSKELLTLDRSNLTNNLWFPQEYMPGVSGSGQAEHWHYHAGVYSAGSSSREFGHFDGSTFMLYTLGYDFARRLDAKKALLAANYVFQDPHPRNDLTRKLHHIGSLTFDYERGKGGFRSDLSAATGVETQSDLWGFLLMPFYNVTERIQIVARYTHLNSADNDGVVFARYETEAVRGRGDEYNEIYAGLNYYLHGHKLKLQTGLQHVDMDDAARNGGEHSGWSWTTGLRVAW
jgi:phosphate-selective porin OprO/OprP